MNVFERILKGEVVLPQVKTFPTTGTDTKDNLTVLVQDRFGKIFTLPIALVGGGGVEGSGTTNRIAKFTASGAIGDSQIFDNGTNVGVGAESTIARLDVRAQGALATDIAFRVRNSADTRNFLVVNGAGDVYNNGASGATSDTFFGENVGRSATGTSNSAFGNNALSSTTHGYGNSAFGINALSSNTTGANNNAFGRDAGRFTSSGLNGISNDSVFIGNLTKAKANNQYNQIVIGSSAVGDGSNSVVLGNSFITRTRLQGQVIMGSFASAPTGIEGAIYYDLTTKKHYGFNGTNWNALY